MTDFITGLLTALSPANLWSGLTTLVDLFVPIILFVLSVSMVGKLILSKFHGRIG